MKDYNVKCSKCRSKAVAVIKHEGIKGTYREPLARCISDKILCNNCGFSHLSSTDILPEYELWYRIDVRGHYLWAVNKEHVYFLIKWLSGNIPWTDLSIVDKAYIETLPKWMINRKTRSTVINKLKILTKK